eukprot:3930840-Pyramimonas_sp.AAC.1
MAGCERNGRSLCCQRGRWEAAYGRGWRPAACSLWSQRACAAGGPMRTALSVTRIQQQLRWQNGGARPQPPWVVGW